MASSAFMKFFYYFPCLVLACIHFFQFWTSGELLIDRFGIQPNETIAYGMVEINDINGPDQKILEDVIRLMIFNHKKHKQCFSGAQHQKLLMQSLNSDYVNKVTNIDLPIGGGGIVSKPRSRATAVLSKVALTLPPGDFVETGSFIGTSAVIMLSILKDFDRCNRKLWVYDSFEGLPSPSPEDRNQGIQGAFSITVEDFQKNLISAGVYSETNPIITKGWFKDTLPHTKAEQIAFLRLDGDLYESTWEALLYLYDRVINGGIIYVDDYGSFNGCSKAVNKFRIKRKIYEPLHYISEPDNAINPRIAFEAVWWIKRYDDYQEHEVEY
jgi:O-methyltransferase